MPLYEYKCHSCGEVFEVLRKFSDPPLKVHTGCGGDVERLLAAPAFQFKGSGWYITDYARKNSSSNGKNGNNGKDSTPAKPETSSPKPETKSSSSESTTKS